MAGMILCVIPSAAIGLLGSWALPQSVSPSDKLLLGAGLLGVGMLGVKYDTDNPRSYEPNWNKLLQWGSLVSLGGFIFLAGAFKR